MPRKCSICTNPHRHEIDEALVLRIESFRTIGERHGVSYASVRRHFENGHVSQELARAVELRRISYSGDLLSKLLFLQHETMKFIDEAKEADKDGKRHWNVAMNGYGKVESMIRTQALLAGKIQETQQNLAGNPVFVSIRQQVFTALSQIPEAQRLVTPIFGEKEWARGTVPIRLCDHPTWKRVRQALFDALEQFPDACAAVERVLERPELAPELREELSPAIQELIDRVMRDDEEADKEPKNGQRTVDPVQEPTRPSPGAPPRQGNAHQVLRGTRPTPGKPR